jgi:hypothetical protein
MYLVRTQFNRIGRKCGRVVCNACSPHRITIPYQFIVQPPTEPNTSSQPNSHARPALDPARAGSSSAFASLVGGERVRLCNPCVPDPNTAPPQTPQFSNQPQRISSNAHSRSASSTNTYTVPQQPTLSSSNPSQSLAAYYLQNHRSVHPLCVLLKHRQTPVQSDPACSEVFWGVSATSDSLYSYNY